MRESLKKVLDWIKSNYKLLLLIVLVVFFFSFPVLILWDSAHYMEYVAIFERKLPFSTWDIVRGPIFPLLIHLSNVLFGKSTMGLLLFSFFFYLFMLVFSKKILDLVIKDKPKLKTVIYVLFTVLVILNPIIYGYYHSLLTEFVAMTVSVISCFLAWKLLDVVGKGNKKGYLFLCIYFVLMFPFAWFLKQPYLSIVFFPLLAAVFLSLWELKSWKKRLQIFFVFCFSLLSLFISLFAWNKILEYKGIDRNTNRTPKNVAGFQLVAALTELDTPWHFNSSEIPEEIEVYNDEGKVIDSLKVELNEEGLITSSSGLKFVLNVIVRHPSIVLKSYLNNYLVLSNIYKFEMIEVEPEADSESKQDSLLVIEENFLPKHCYQNCIIATNLLKEKSNIFHMTPELYTRVVDYEQKVNPPIITSFILGLNKNLSIVVTNYSILLLPFMLVIALILYFVSIKRKRVYSRRILPLVIILLVYSFLHVLLHAFTGAIVDRYVSPVHITVFLGYILLIFSLFPWKKIHKEVRES